METFGDGYDTGERQGEANERRRLRPLLERALRALHAARPDIEKEAHEQVIADLRRELGKEE